MKTHFQSLLLFCLCRSHKNCSAPPHRSSPGSTAASVDAATAVRRHCLPLLLLIVILPLLSTLPSSVKKPFKLVPRRRLHLAASFTAASVVTAAFICRHCPTLLLLMIMLPLLPTLLSSVKTPSQAGTTAPLTSCCRLQRSFRGCYPCHLPPPSAIAAADDNPTSADNAATFR